MMRAWGWKEGEPLGVRGHGITAPVEAVRRLGNPKAGLGTSGKKRKVSDTKEPKLSTDKKLRGAFINGELVIGELRGSSAIAPQQLDVNGHPLPADGSVEWLQGPARPVTKWGGGVVGIAEAMYPHPDRWRLADIDAPLDSILPAMT